jgi:hypothetical protein
MVSIPAPGLLTSKPTSWNRRLESNHLPNRSLCHVPVAYTVNQPENSRLSHRKWPWRILAFSSDLGTVGYLVKLPQLGLVGWLLALPYYVLAVARQPNVQSQKEELLYQSTANGLFPLIEAKLGILAADNLHKGFAPRLTRQGISGLNSLASRSVWKMLGSLIALATLTPTLGDRISHWLLKQYRNKVQEGSILSWKA